MARTLEQINSTQYSFLRYENDMKKAIDRMDQEIEHLIFGLDKLSVGNAGGNKYAKSIQSAEAFWRNINPNTSIDLDTVDPVNLPGDLGGEIDTVIFD